MELEQERVIVEECKSDLSRFTLIYDAYVGDVYRYCYSISKSKETAQDAVSFAFLQAIEKIKDYEFQGKSIKNWLFIIARNHIFKSDKKKEILDEKIEEMPDENEDILEQIADDMDAARVKDIIEDLNPDEKEIVKLKIWEELKFEEIAEITKLGLSSVKMKYYRALGEIKSRIN